MLTIASYCNRDSRHKQQHENCEGLLTISKTLHGRTAMQNGLELQRNGKATVRIRWSLAFDVVRVQ